MIAIALAATSINLVFLVAAEVALGRVGAKKRLCGIQSILGICALSVAETFLLRSTTFAQTEAALLLIAGLGASVITDIKTGLILDAITLPTLTAIVVLSSAYDVLSSVEGAVGCTLMMLLLYAASGRRGMGLGDVKLSACAGAALGPVHGAQSIGLAFAFGGTIAAGLLLTGRATPKSVVPFAPYLASGALAMLAIPKA